MKSEVLSLKFEVWSLKSLWSIKYEVWCLMSYVRSAKSEVLRPRQSEFWSLKYEVWTMKYEIQSLTFRILKSLKLPKTLKSVVWSLKC